CQCTPPHVNNDVGSETDENVVLILVLLHPLICSNRALLPGLGLFYTKLVSKSEHTILVAIRFAILIKRKMQCEQQDDHTRFSSMAKSDDDDAWPLHDAFVAYAMFGDEHRNRGRVMNMTNALRWLRAARIPELVHSNEFDLKELLIQITNARCINQTVLPHSVSAVLSERPVNMAQFELFVDLLAKLKNVDACSLRQRLRSCGPPNSSMDIITTAGIRDLWTYIHFDHVKR
uniref:Uncharacterized protein n=1 Tax=Strigamia maritima TaxID=126957 RepID=T1IL60_STRMM